MKTLTEDRLAQRMLAVHLTRNPLREDDLMAVVFVGEDGAGASPSNLPALHPAYEPPSQRFPTWTNDGAPGHHFFRVFGPTGTTSDGEPRLRPWVDVLHPFTSGLWALSAFATEAHDLLLRANAAAILIRRGVAPAPFLVVPGNDLALGLGLYPSFSAAEGARAGSVMQTFAGKLLGAGGKRYPCGYFGPTDVGYWAEHYGPRWVDLCAAKAHHDPARRFAVNLVQWPPRPEP